LSGQPDDRHAPGSPLRITRLFEHVPEAEQRLLFAATAPLHLKKGQRLFERGDPGGTMYVVLSGRIEISMLTEAGRKVSLNLIGPGNCFGEISMLDNRDRTASAVAAEDVELQPITRATFFAGIKRCPDLAITLMEILCQRVRWVSDSVEDYAVLPLHQRLARRLLLLQDQFAGPGGAIEIAQSDLADFAGATRESTNKILMQWKSQGLIAMKRRAIRINDRAEIERLAHESTV